ncbi:MAG: DNA repair protein RecN [Clostridium sp.]|nr:DNA repair protein RecN [Clostridium sp.]MCM1547367.1 DNA repair protein RecN [Ruminococcus sp.]
MLREVYIENLAVIEKAVIPFSDSFNAFTGETGAGKSILINGINAVLGQRVTKDIVRTGSKKAVITALFTGLSENVCNKLDELGISHENDEITVTREIAADGGSVARINSRTTTVSILREIGDMLITIHGQHDNQILLSPEKHIEVLDGFGELTQTLEDYRSSFRSLQSMAKKLGDMKKNRIEKRDRAILLKDRISELEQIDLHSTDYGELENEYNMIQNVDRIAGAVRNINAALNGDDTENVIDMLGICEEEIGGIADYSNEASELYDRLVSLKIELTDISDEINRIGDSLDIDERRFQYVTSAYNKINHFMKKYNCDYEELVKLYDESKAELETIEFSEEDMNKLSVEKDRLLHEATEKAKNLSSQRKAVAERFTKQVTEELSFLDMPNVVIEIRQERGKLTVNGMDSIEFLISANKGETPRPIAKIASGGELSRIMLALKSVIAEKDSIPTLIFDEIDTGVSGRAAQKIGIKIKQISKIRQILCVTHLSQLAVMSDNHLLIEKNVVGDRTVTSVTPLDFEGRIKEIARIMGGEDPSDTLLKSAEEELRKAAGI